MSGLRKITQIKNFSGKRVLLRADLDVPLEQKRGRQIETKITDDTRLHSLILTLKYMWKRGATVFICGHLGRPKKKFELNDPKFIIEKDNALSLYPIAKWLARRLKTNKEPEYEPIGGFWGWKIDDRVFLLENLRFLKGEEENSEHLAKELAGLCDIYVNDAFATSHRRNASIVGIAKERPSFAGFWLAREVTKLSKVLNNPTRPLVVIIGGAKIETKLPLVFAMHRKADFVLVGGEIAEQDRVLIKVQHEKIKGKRAAVLVADLVHSGKDITEKSIENFCQIINLARTIVWNGPLGEIGKIRKIKIRKGDTEWGTYEVARKIAESNAYKVVGGGDTIAFLKKVGLLRYFNFVSVGGGAMLEFLAGKKLPGLEVLKGK